MGADRRYGRGGGSACFAAVSYTHLDVYKRQDTASLAAVAAVRTAEFDELFTPEMARTGTAVPGTAEYLDVVNEIGRGHMRRFSA